MTEVSRLPDGKKHWSFLSDTPPDLPGHYFMSTTRGFMTVFVAFMLLLNDIGEFIWGWPDYEFSVDKNKSSFLNINVDMVMWIWSSPCHVIVSVLILRRDIQLIPVDSPDCWFEGRNGWPIVFEWWFSPGWHFLRCRSSNRPQVSIITSRLKSFANINITLLENILLPSQLSRQSQSHENPVEC